MGVDVVFMDEVFDCIDVIVLFGIDVGCFD